MSRHAQLLDDLTGRPGWQGIDGPDCRVGVDFWYRHPDGSEAYVNEDQGSVTVVVNGETLFQGMREGLPRETSD